MNDTNRNKIFQLLLAFCVLTLALYFMFSPIFEHKKFDDFMNANVGKFAAECGVEDVAKKHLELVQDKSLKLEVELYLAILKASKDDSFDGGKFKNNDLFKAKKIEFEMLAEDKILPKLFELKYLPRIEALKSHESKAYCFYLLSVKMGKAGKPFADAAYSEIQKAKNYISKDEYVLKILPLTISSLNVDDFVRFSKLTKHHYKDTIVCCDLYKDEAFVKEFSKLKDKKDIFYRSARIWDSYSALRQKKEVKESLVLKLKYIALGSGSWGVWNCVEISYPAISYIAYLADRKDAMNEYKDLAISKETLSKFNFTRIQYLTYCASIFAKMEDTKLAFELIKEASYSASSELRALHKMLPFLPKDESTVKTLSERVEYLTSYKGKICEISM